MLKGFTVAVIASTLLVMGAPSAVAFHGSPFKAFGTACIDGTAVCLPAAVEWGGGGVYRITVGVAQAQQVTVPIGTVAGREVFTRVWFGADDWCAFTEFTEYLGYDVPTNGADFRVTGTQDNCLSNGGRQIHLVGHYKTFDLDVKV